MLIRYPAMAVERVEPQPLEYSPSPRRRRMPRSVIVTLIGASSALIGTVLIACAHKLADENGLGEEHLRLHELRWAGLGLAMLLAGALITAGGLQAWCRSEAG